MAEWEEASMVSEYGGRPWPDRGKRRWCPATSPMIPRRWLYIGTVLLHRYRAGELDNGEMQSMQEGELW